MEYWIIINGKAEGPYGIEEMLRHGATPETPVWRQGMTEWVPAATVRELADHFAATGEIKEQPLGYTTPPPSPTVTATGPVAPAAPQPAYNPFSGQAAPRDVPPMPPTRLGWNIAATILCCIPAGIIGIVFSAMVRNKYDQGDYDGALKASNRASLWFILSVVLGIISGVFVVAVNLISGL